MRGRMKGTLGNMVQKAATQWPSHFYRFLCQGLWSAVNQRGPTKSKTPLSPLGVAFRFPFTDI